MIKTVSLPARPLGLATLVGLTLVVSSAMVAVVVYYLFPSQLPEATAIKLVPDTTEASVAALGRIEPQGEVINLSAPASAEAARVEQLLVKLGDSVKVGQIIAILDSRDRLQVSLERAKTQVQIAQSRLAQVKAGAKQGTLSAQKAAIARLSAELQGQMTLQKASIDRIGAELDNAQTECNRYQTLYQAGAIAASERDNICLKATTFAEQLVEQQANRDRIAATLRQQLSEQQATLNELAEVRPVDVALAKAELVQAQVSVRQAQADLDLAYIRALQAGQILKIHAYPGEIVGEQGIVELGQTEQMVAIAEVYETDITQVHIGQPVKLETPSLHDPLQGKVSEIGLQIGKKDVLGTDPAADVDARVVEVKILLDRPSSQKVQSLTNLQVNVIINAKKLN